MNRVDLIFYVFIFIFTSTAIVTLLGVTKLREIPDQYLKHLVPALLLEVIAFVLLLASDLLLGGFEKNVPVTYFQLPDGPEVYFHNGRGEICHVPGENEFIEHMRQVKTDSAHSAPGNNHFILHLPASATIGKPGLCKI